MIECPEANVLAKQLKDTYAGKTIVQVIANQHPHKFAWFSDAADTYEVKLIGRMVEDVVSYGGLIEVVLGDMRLTFGDGVVLKWQASADNIKQKHQLMLIFNDDSVLTGSVQMYGGLWCFKAGTNQNPYYSVAKEKPSPLTSAFDRSYFDQLGSQAGVEKLSLKAFLATEQRIPGFGNGVLQDVLFRARLHPKTKWGKLETSERMCLYQALKDTLSDMAVLGGRDTETDLFGQSGGYKTTMSKLGCKNPCPVCGGIIQKENYLGGSIYFCAKCQTNPVQK